MPDLPAEPEDRVGEAMIFFFYGDNRYGVTQQLTKLKQEFMTRTGGDEGFVRIDGQSASEEQLVASISSMPLFSSSRLVVIDCLLDSKHAPRLESILQSVSEQTVVVFVEQSVDKRTAAFKLLQTRAKAIEFSPLTTYRLKSWVQQTVKGNGFFLEAPAIALLLEKVGADQWRLANEINKLSHLGKPEVSLHDVETHVSGEIEPVMFELTEELAARRLPGALEKYQHLRDRGVSEYQILTMIIWQLRVLLYASLEPNASVADIAKKAACQHMLLRKLAGLPGVGK